MKIYELIDSQTKNIYNIDALTWIKKENVEKFKTIIPNLCCPCCSSKDYEIIYLKEKSYLKTNPEKHLEFCDYYKEKQSNNDVKSLIAKNDKQLIEYLKFSLLESFHQNPICKKSLKLKINKYDYNKPVIFYGEVIPKYKGINNLEIESYEFITASKDVINISISKKASQIIIKRYDKLLKEKKPLKLSFIGILKRDGRFNNLTISKSNSIYINNPL